MLLETTSFDARISVCNTYELPATIKLPATYKFAPTLAPPHTCNAPVLAADACVPVATTILLEPAAK